MNGKLIIMRGAINIKSDDCILCAGISKVLGKYLGARSKEKEAHGLQANQNCLLSVYKSFEKFQETIHLEK